MTDTPLTHPNSHPQRMLMAHKKILVQSKKTQPKGKHYKKYGCHHLHKCLTNGIFNKTFVELTF